MELLFHQDSINSWQWSETTPTIIDTNERLMDSLIEDAFVACLKACVPCRPADSGTFHKMGVKIHFDPKWTIFDVMIGLPNNHDVILWQVPQTPQI